MATALQIVQKFYPNVTSVVDAHRNITIEVTKQDANSKQVKNHKECALAVACKRELHADAAVICVKTAYIITGDKAVRYSNPESISREVVAFDRNARFLPGIYTLAKISPSMQLGRNRRTHGRGVPKKRVSYHRTEDIRVID